ncbi:MAG TPA: sigma-70 family RNA polymerase sigma factor [Acidimicrobiales bacterium]|nr:sigma-70 family RNA polymerase sigma factor [Acidimicrobiales bacterium]
MHPASDDTLLASFAVGDADAAAIFIRRYQGRVYGLAKSMVGDASLAEDVAQEAFVRAWRHAPAYDARRGSVHTWLLVITRNLAIDAMRMRRAQPVDPEVLSALELEAGPEGSPEYAADINDQMRDVRAALAELPAEQRQAVVLAAFGGRTAKEISERESIPLGTAKTRIRTGLMKVRSSMATRRSDQ